MPGLHRPAAGDSQRTHRAIHAGDFALTVDDTTSIRSARTFAACLLLYAVLAIALTWPLALQADRAVPNDLGDPLLNVWLIDWNARAVPLTTRWWNAPQFYPTEGVTAFSEHLLGLSIVTTPIVAATGNPLLAYNAAFLLSFVLSAAAAHLLCYSITRRHDAALVAAVAFGFAPYRMGQLAHIQVLSSYWMPVSLAALHWYRETGRRRWAVLAAGAWAMQAITCGYYLFYFSVLAGLWLLWFRGERVKGHYRLLASTWTAASLVLIPIARGYLHYQSAYGLGRGIDEIKSLSADAASLLKAPEYLRVWGWLDVYGKAESDLFPGLVLPVTIAVGVATALAGRWRAPDGAGRSRVRSGLIAFATLFAAVAISPLIFGPWSLRIGGARLLSVSDSHKPLSLAVVLIVALIGSSPVVRAAWRRSSALAFYVFAAIVMWLFSLGPEPTLFGDPVLYKAPYSWLMLLPGVNGIRVPARFWMLAALCLATAGGIALARLTAANARARVAAPIVVAALLLMEAWPRPIPLQAPPEAHPARSDAIARLELPMSPIDDPSTLYRATQHHLPVLNGYSGYFAPHYWILHGLLKWRVPEAIPELARLGPLEIVVDHAGDADGAWRAWLQASPGVKVVGTTATFTTFYVAKESAFSAEPGSPDPALTIAAITASNGATDVLAAVTDGNSITRWFSDDESDRTQSIALDLGSAAQVSTVVLELGGYVADYPGRLRVETSLDGATWTSGWSGFPGVQAFVGALREPLTVPIRLPFPPRQARFLRIEETAGERDRAWTIAELRVLGRRSERATRASQ